MRAKMTYDDFRLLPDDGRRIEVIDGVQYIQKTPNTAHQRVSCQLLVAIQNHLKQHRVGEVFTARLDVVLSHYDIVEPDLIFVSKARKHIITEPNIQGAPDLLIEIVSDETREFDEVLKFGRYEALGVGEYWIVDPDAGTVAIHRREGRNFARIAVHDNLTTPLLPGFTMPIAGIFDLRD